MRILLSNDDGVHAEGLRILRDELSKIADVWVVAPLEERSTMSHSLTIHKPLRMIKLAPKRWGVSGSPADCVYLGMREALGFKPDLVVSGINRGANLGQDVYYSGTVAAAREACILGIPAIAVSTAAEFMTSHTLKDIHFSSAAKLASKVIKMLSKIEIPQLTFLNLNVPDLPLSKIRGIKLARQGFRFYSGKVLCRKDHRGKDYFWIGGKYRGYMKEGETDCSVTESGYASLTPFRLDSTDLQFMAALSKVKGLK